ncbi:hypothetical protein BELL_1207g00020 [Botrytis elliptica]|uniref:6-methylsalicylate decarboxylase n=1 Tax=Botrytis elliptica TaxID=278938 RepID=A0A4Z1IM63_9HELO|nr:hypothetical protein BELL_1207g00020 [Botrytis elliptica]
MTDTLRTHPNCRVILPHGGGTLPYIVHRNANLSAEFNLVDKTADEFLKEAKNFYFDLAFAGYDEPLRLFLDFAEPGHALYGTDYPFGREDLGRKDEKLVYRDAALKLWTKFDVSPHLQHEMS